jgi:cytochrome c oxidase assembly protein subunit 15
MDLSHGFELWRQLGRTADQGFISTSALIAIHWVHRTFAVVAASLLGWLVIYLYRLKANVLATGLLGLLALQLGTGLGNVLLRWPLAVAVFHSAGAAALVITLVVVNYRVAQSHHSKAGHSAQTARLAAI